MPRSRVQRTGIGAALLMLLTTMAVDATAAAEQRQEVSREVERTIRTGENQSLRIDHRHGDVRITSHARGDLQIRAAIRVSATSQEAAAAFADRIEVEVVETAAGVSVRTRYPAQGNSDRNLSFSVDYTVAMPERMPLDVRNSFGNTWLTGAKAGGTVVSAQGTLTVADCAGKYRLANSFGAVDVTRVNGDVAVTNANGALSVATVGGGVDLTNRFGLVKASAIRGAAVVASSNGQVDVNEAASANITNSFGAVTVGTIGGDATVRNSNGNVTARAVRGKATISASFGTVEARDLGAASIENRNGSVNVSEVHGPADIRSSFGLINAETIGGPLIATNANGGVRATTVRGTADVRTSFGPVVLRGVEGKVDVHNRNGAIDVGAFAKTGQCHDVTLTTSFSPIKLQLPEAGYTVSARTSFGRIRSDLPVTVTGTVGEGSLAGTIGPGGCALQLNNANGDIQINRAPR